MNIDKTEHNWWESKWLTIILLLMLCLWRIPFLNKGIDCLDTGFSLENYINVFQGNGVSDIGLILTTLLGGLIYEILPAYQLLVYRILHWLIGLLTIAFAYKIFRKYLPKNLILVVLLAVNLGTKAGEALYGYYPMTSCILMASVYFLLCGLNKEKKSYIALSGFLSGINVFFRLPNLLFLSMCICLVWYGVYCKYETRYIVRVCAVYFAGAAASLLITLPLMLIFLGPDKIVDSVMGYVNLALGKTGSNVENFLGISEKSSHSLFNEIKTIAQQGFYSIRTVLCCFGIILAVNYLLDRILGDENRRITKNLILFVAMLIVSVLFRSWINYSKTEIMGLYSVFLSLFLVIKTRKHNALLSTMFLLNIVIGICVIFGSDLGLKRFGVFSTYMSLTIALAIISFVKYNYEINIFSKLKFRSDILINAGVFLLIGFFIANILIVLPNSFGDEKVKELKYPVREEISAFKGMKTSQIRADQINEYYELMTSEEIDDQEVAVFGYFAIGFAIAPHKDYFEDVQPCIDYPSVSVESLLKVINEKEEANIAPVIVVSYCNQIQRNDDHFTTDAKVAVLNYMLSLHDYHVYSESNYFKIYVPQKDI